LNTLSQLLYLHPVHSALDTRCALDARARIERPAEAGGVAPYHLVAAGSAQIHIAGEPSICLGAGDLVVLARGQAHAIAACGDMSGQSAAPGLSATPPEILCGQFRSGHAASSALLCALPAIVLIRASSPRRLADITALMRMLGEQDGSGATARHLASALFSMLLDAWLEQGSHVTGLLALMAEPKLRPALQKMLAHPGADCSIDQMAAACHLSRSTFLRIFRHASGDAPAEVLLGLRMAEARLRLARGERSIGRIAEAVGYQSESAFNKAFKRHTGIAPGKYRRDLPHAFR